MQNSHSHRHGHRHEHECSHKPGGHHGQQVPKILIRALLVTVVFMFVELVGGYFANSLALLSDAAHMLTDVGAMLLSLFAFWISRRPSTPTMSFGYHRAEIIGALTSGLVIWLLAGMLMYEAILRLNAPPAVNGQIVFVIALIGLGANLLSMWLLYSAKGSNINVRAAYIHLLADSLGSIGAIIAGLVIWITGWRPIDIIATFIFSVLMLAGSWRLIKESVGVLMESSPSGVDPMVVRRHLEQLGGVREVHDLHIWSVSSGRLALSVHLVSNDPEKLLHLAHNMLKERHGIFHTTIQVEHPNEFKSERCYDCSQA